MSTIDEQAVTVAAPDGAAERIPARNAIWAAGVEASRLASQLGELSGADVDRAGRVTVEPDLTLPGHPEVLALGDMVRVRSRDGGVQELLGVAPVAMQQGRYAAKLVRARLSGRPIEAFHYLDKGNLATIGRARAVADLHLHPAERLPRLGRLAGGAPLLPRRLPEPPDRPHPLVHQLRHPRSRGPAHHELPGNRMAASTE